MHGRRAGAGVVGAPAAAAGLGIGAAALPVRTSIFLWFFSASDSLVSDSISRIRLRFSAITGSSLGSSASDMAEGRV